QLPKFKHIHGDGWSCIIGDLDLAQIIGLGETLALIDSSYTRKQSKTNTLTKKRSTKTSKNKQLQKLTESSSNNNDSPLNINNELVMKPMEKLEYEERMLLIQERKEKLRELRIANTIKEREYGLEQE
ncbi:21965_t:CDS:2, partial [Racocetra persica]